MKKEIVYMDQEVNTFYVTAESYLTGLEAAQKKLKALVRQRERRSFGISYPDAYGQLVFHAALERYADECSLECRSFRIRKGGFLAYTFKDGRSKRHLLGSIFLELFQDVRAHPFGYCLEMYANESDVMCMVPLKSNY